MTGRMWMASRAALALALMVSFYALALGLSAFLLWLTYAQTVYLKHANAKISLLLVGAAATILWSIVPRPDRFAAPGPRVASTEEPVLFSALQEIASSTGQAMPVDVYLVNDVNAFVGQRGGVMGVGSRRVMGLGLPLMQAVTVQEFKGILAHEFGHYHAGDVALGPWIHKTRSAIGRTIQRLSGNLLQKIFIWYGTLFLRVTHAVSRRQEFIADEVAANAAGAGAMISGLRKVHASSVAFQHFWNGEVAPVLGSGYLPPLSQGSAASCSTKRSPRTWPRPFSTRRVRVRPIPSTRIPRCASASRRCRPCRRALPATPPGGVPPLEPAGLGAADSRCRDQRRLGPRPQAHRMGAHPRVRLPSDVARARAAAAEAARAVHHRDRADLAPRPRTAGRRVRRRHE